MRSYLLNNLCIYIYTYIVKFIYYTIYCIIIYIVYCIISVHTKKILSSVSVGIEIIARDAKPLLQSHMVLEMNRPGSLSAYISETIKDSWGHEMLTQS